MEIEFVDSFRCSFIIKKKLSLVLQEKEKQTKASKQFYGELASSGTTDYCTIRGAM